MKGLKLLAFGSAALALLLVAGCVNVDEDAERTPDVNVNVPNDEPDTVINNPVERETIREVPVDDGPDTIINNPPGNGPDTVINNPPGNDRDTVINNPGNINVSY